MKMNKYTVAVIVIASLLAARYVAGLVIPKILGPHEPVVVNRYKGSVFDHPVGGYEPKSRE